MSTLGWKDVRVMEPGEHHKASGLTAPSDPPMSGEKTRRAYRYVLARRKVGRKVEYAIFSRPVKGPDEERAAAERRRAGRK